MVNRTVVLVHDIGISAAAGLYSIFFRLARRILLPGPATPKPIRLPADPLAAVPASYAEIVTVDAIRRFWWLR
jgi:hypothetical protein